MISQAYTKEEILAILKKIMIWIVVGLVLLVIVLSWSSIKSWSVNKFYGSLASPVEIVKVKGFRWSSESKALMKEFAKIGFEVVGCFEINKFPGKNMAFVNMEENLYGILNQKDYETYWEMFLFYEDGNSTCWSSKEKTHEPFPPQQRHVFFREPFREIERYDSSKIVDMSDDEPIPISQMFDKALIMRDDKPVKSLTAENFQQDIHDYLWEYAIWDSKRALERD